MAGMTPEAPAIADDAYPKLLEVVKARRSVRNFEPGRDVPRETLLRILEAGRWAPSGANAQHWDFICVDDPGVREQVREVFLRQGARLSAQVRALPGREQELPGQTRSRSSSCWATRRFKACFPAGRRRRERRVHAQQRETIF